MSEPKYYVYIYLIKNTKEVFYVGKGCNDRYRVIRGRNKFFLDMYNHHECEVKIVARNLEEEKAYELEHLLVWYYRNRTNFRLTNQTDGGDGTRGYKPTKEQIEKARIASKRMWQDAEWRERIISDRHKPDSVFQSKEFKEKISMLVKGENNPNYGHKWTQEMKDNLSKKRKLNGLSKGGNNPRAIRVQCVETGEIFDCMEDAAKSLGLKCGGSIYVCLKNPKRIAGGYHWISLNKK